MFHGLHCLKMLREVIQSSRSGMDGEHVDGVKGGGHGHGHMHGQSMNHIGHCIGYIAQVCDFINHGRRSVANMRGDSI